MLRAPVGGGSLNTEYFFGAKFPGTYTCPNAGIFTCFSKIIYVMEIIRVNYLNYHVTALKQ